MLEIGKVYEGKVKGITSYGAFVEIPLEGEAPVTGMVHISEIANTFVNDVRDYLKEEQDVKVLVLQRNEQGKISLSIKKALPPEEKPAQKSRPPKRQDRGEVWNPKPQKPASEMSFEDMMTKFKQNSDERMSDIKRNTDRKNKSRRRPN